MIRRTGKDGQADEEPLPAKIEIVRGAHKLIFFREGGSQKHIDDIKAMIDAGAICDLSELMRWIDKLDLHREWKIVSEPQ